MRTKIYSFFLFMLLPGMVLAGEAKIISMSGTVEARQAREGQWVPASENMEIAEGGAIRTSADGAAVMLMPNKTKVWMKESSSLELEQRQTLASRLALAFGRIKVRVPHLMRKEKFEVRTPAAVCAVRGTEFTMGTTEEGKMDLQVLFGEVKLKFVVPPEKGKSEFNIPQGQGLNMEEKGKAAKPALLSPKAEREAMENWNPGLKPEERQKDLRQKENDRAQVKEFAKAANNTDSAIKGFVNVVKESDLEAGRTLTDVHGNLVRVDQRMMRPAADEIQFFNLVKRPTYANYTADNAGFAYNGGAVTSRLDYMQMTMNFNKDLPQRIEEWPGFFNGNEVNAEWASFILANRTLSDEIFFIGQGYAYDAGRDELVNNTLVVDPTQTNVSLIDRNVIVTGILKGNTAVAGLGKITNLDFKDAGASNGTLNYGDNSAVNVTGSDVVWAVMADKSNSYAEPASGSRPDNAPLVQYQADMYSIGGNTSNNVWFAKENYVIGNGGQIRTPGDFTKSSSDPFSLLKDNALETVMYIKKSKGAAPTAITSSLLAKNDISEQDYFAYTKNGSSTAGVGTNIDIVFIPDLMIAAVQRMLPAITNLKD